MSTFFGKGKKLAWQAWNFYPGNSGFHLHGGESLSAGHWHQSFQLSGVLHTCPLWQDHPSEAWREIFCYKSKSMENIPPTEDALPTRLETGTQVNWPNNKLLFQRLNTEQRQEELTFFMDHTIHGLQGS